MLLSNKQIVLSPPDELLLPHQAVAHYQRLTNGRGSVLSVDVAAAKKDFWRVAELAGSSIIMEVRASIAGGRVEGTRYYGECSCLLGTICRTLLKNQQLNAQALDLYRRSYLQTMMRSRPEANNTPAFLLLQYLGYQPDGMQPVEQFFYQIHQGDTPLTSDFARLAFEWCDEFLVENRVEAPAPEAVLA